jgi:hypothetical protein
MILFAYHCQLSQKYLKCVKDLTMFWDVIGHPHTKENTFIVDDLEEVQLENEKNVFKAKYFDVLAKNSENDKYLSRLTKKLKQIFL